MKLIDVRQPERKLSSESSDLCNVRGWYTDSLAIDLID